MYDVGQLVKKVGAVASVCVGLILVSGCSSTGLHSDSLRKEQVVIVEKPYTPPKGVVKYKWEEPMVDVVKIPAGLDPEGYYYRPEHEEIVEIKQGGWRRVDSD